MCRSKTEAPPNGRRCPSSQRRTSARTTKAAAAATTPRRTPRTMPSATPHEIEQVIREAYRSALARSRNPNKTDSDYLPLSVVQRRIDALSATPIPRADRDRVLDRMIESPDVHLQAELRQRLLTDEDRGAAVNIGGELRHNIRIGPQ